ncbi:hypothetical protein [Occallatibacter savannae]|uniref:hypothetical protein n=1 Tax=Occallatibacter savannae TaxID=1002691 RepID=UPI000D686AF9|nr:hypothetical protein [Occallatibacter savannae]
MNDSPGTLQSLAERVDDLEKRVRALEHSPEPTIAVRQDEHTRSQQIKADQPPAGGSLLPVLGQALLGVAGAYVLRAIAASGTLPRFPVSAVAVVYAFTWLIWAARTGSGAARQVFAATAALILAPMLWENTLAFHVFTPVVAAGVLAAFMTLAVVLESTSSGSRSVSVAQSIAALTAAALGFSTLEALPFITALLIAIGASDFLRSREVPQPVWPLLVLVADAAISGLLFIYSGPPDTRALYPVLSIPALIAPALMLFLLNAVSVAVRVLARRRTLLIFEAVQVFIAFALTVASVLIFSPTRGAILLGIGCILLSAAGYFAVLRYLAQREERRTFRIFAALSAALLISGSSLVVSREPASLVLAVAGLSATYLSRRTQPAMLSVQGAIFIVSSAALAGLPNYFYTVIAGSSAAPPHAAAIVVSLCLVTAMVFSSASSRERAFAASRIVQTAIGLVAICAVIALLVHGLIAGVGAGMALAAHHIAFLRTLAICGVALAVAFEGPRWGRPELTLLAWTALAGVGLKLLLEDMRHGHMGFVAASIAVFAITLMSVPRLVQLGDRKRSAAEAATTASESSVV